MPTNNTIQELINYINLYVKTNGNQEITGDIENKVQIDLAYFIQNSILNNSKADIYSTPGAAVVVNKAFNIFTQVPTSIAWDNTLWYNEYYLVNMTGSVLSLLSGYSYYDVYGDAKTTIPARTVIHIAKTTADLWVQVNNLGSGSGGNLPPQTGHEGEFLATNGTSAAWISPLIPITSSDFESDGVTYINTNIPGTQFKYALFWNDIPRFIYESTEWEYITGGGFEVIIPGFDANTSDYNLYLFLYGLND